jgi:hypothetical protein
MSDNINPVTQNYSELLTSADAVPEQELSALSPRQLAALDLMLLGQSDTSISTQLSIARKTLYTWRTHDPNFRAAYESHHRALLTQSTSRFRTLMDNALDTLEKQVKDPYTPTSHRAAKTLLSLARISTLLNPKSPSPRGVSTSDRHVQCPSG